MKKIFTILSTVFLMTSFTARADVQVGFGLMMGQLGVDGKETESANTGTETSVRSKSFDEFFVGADVFIEYVLDNNLALGVSYTPVDFEIGSGTRTDSAVTTATGGAENDVGDRKAQAEVSNLFTVYTNVPLGSSGLYGLLGASQATIKSSTTLPSSTTYADKDILGYNVGIGVKSGKVKAELSFVDFEDVSVTGSSSDHSISADADAVAFRVAIAF